MNLLDKIGLIIAGKAHAVLDQAMDADALAQLIRELESDGGDLNNELANAKGNVVVLKQDITGLEGQIAATNANIDLLLGDADESNDKNAVRLEQRLIGMEKDLEEAKAELQTAEMLVTSIEEALSVVTSRTDEANSRLENLRAAERAASAKEKAAATLDRISSIASGAGQVSVDNLEDRIRRRAASADARLAQSTAKIGSGSVEQSVVQAEAAERIKARRANMAGKANAA